MIRNFSATESQHLRIIKFPQPVQVLEIVDMIKLLHRSLAPRDMLFGCRMTPAGLKTEVIVQERKPLIYVPLIVSPGTWTTYCQITRPGKHTKSY